jgi:hypothetical protein
VNKCNPLYSDSVSLVSKQLGFKAPIENILQEVGNVEAAHFVGDDTQHINSKSIELFLIETLNREYWNLYA